MKIENKSLEDLQPLEEAQLLQEFHVEELEKRYEFAWIDRAFIGGNYNGWGAGVYVPL
jgi:hypothetical protein